jgi:molybdate transport system ATP-binding protein
LHHYPHELSGGQQQRTALARILVSSPNILLLDEPFSALDSHLRFKLEQEVREVVRKFGKSVILVSHDRDEVFRLSDKIAVMHDGTVDCFGTKKEVFADPQTKAAAMLTGCKNISPVEIIGSNRIKAADWGVELTVPSIPEGTAYAGIRMHDIRSGHGENSVLCRVTEEIENPFSFTVMLTPENAPGAAPFGWELDKSLWQSLRQDTVEVNFPESSIILLR